MILAKTGGMLERNEEKPQEGEVQLELNLPHPSAVTYQTGAVL